MSSGTCLQLHETLGPGSLSASASAPPRDDPEALAPAPPAPQRHVAVPVRVG